MHNKYKIFFISLLILVPYFGHAMRRGITMKAVGPIVVDSERTQPIWSRGTSPMVFWCIDRLLGYRLSRFSFSFLSTVALIELCNHLDRGAMMELLFPYLKRVDFMRRSNDDLLFLDAEEPVPTLDDFVDHIQQIARDNDGKCAAVFSRNGKKIIVATRDAQWFFVSLDHQSAREHFAVGSHRVMFNEKDDALAYIEHFFDMTEPDVFNDEWHAVFYTRITPVIEPRNAAI